MNIITKNTFTLNAIRKAMMNAIQDMEIRNIFGIKDINVLA